MAVATVIRTQAPLDRLFEGSERWGWEYRDPSKFYRPYPTPEPTLVIPADLAKRGGSKRAILLAVLIGFIAYVIFFSVLGTKLGGLAFLLGLAAGVFAWRVLRTSLAGDPVKKLQKEHEEAVGKWRDSMLAHDRAEWEFLNTLPLYGPVPMPPVRRVDVFGGTPYGWISLMTTFGTSCLAGGSGLTIVDLSEWAVAEELVRLATDKGLPLSVQRLPQGLAEFDILSGLGPGELVDILVETLHGDEKDATRRNRALDERLLGQVCDALGNNLTIERVLAGLRTILGQEPDPSRSESPLKPEEWDKLRAAYKDEVRQESRERAIALEAQLYPLRTLGSRPNDTFGTAVPLRYIAISAGGSTLVNDLIVDLLPQLLIRVFRSTPGEVTSATMVVAGADKLQRRHLEKLSELANQRRVRLVYMFKSLRESSADLLGGGGAAALFMKLGNPQEADRAAQFIGKGYKFELSQLSQSVSNSISHAIGITEGQAESQNTFPTPGGSVSRNWGVTRNLSEQFTTQDGKTVQRVYEYAVEPTILQQLPETDILFVHLDAKRGGRVVKSGDCNPDILTLPRVSPSPLVAPTRVRNVLSS